VDRIAALLGLDREAVEPGGSAVLLPYLDGERTPNLPFASGLLTGLRHETTPGQLLQAAYDGPRTRCSQPSTTSCGGAARSRRRTPRCC